MKTARDLADEARTKCEGSKYNALEYALFRSQSEKDKAMAALWMEAADIIKGWQKPH